MEKCAPGRELADGRVYTTLNLMIVYFAFSVETINDGLFHTVELVMLNQTLSLVVDKGAPKSLGKLQKQPSLNLNTPLYLGGRVFLAVKIAVQNHKLMCHFELFI